MHDYRYMTPVADGLPERCYAMHPTENKVIVLERGKCRYGIYTRIEPQYASNDAVDDLNKRLGVTPAQRQAMMMGSLFGWNIPAADPKYWIGGR